jgi:hypothetical protein
MKFVSAMCALILMVVATASTSAQSNQMIQSQLRVELTNQSDSVSIYVYNIGRVKYLYVNNGQWIEAFPLQSITEIYVEALGGDDLVSFSGDFGDVGGRVFGRDGRDVIDCGDLWWCFVNGGNGDDVIWGTDGADLLLGGDGDDEIRGFGANDWLYGMYGDDEIFGGDGNDSLSGGYGHDTLVGQAGGDYLTGGNGNDALRPGGGEQEAAVYGGRGADKFYVMLSKFQFIPTVYAMDINSDDSVRNIWP